MNFATILTEVKVAWVSKSEIYENGPNTWIKLREQPSSLTKLDYNSVYYLEYDEKSNVRKIKRVYLSQLRDYETHPEYLRGYNNPVWYIGPKVLVIKHDIAVAHSVKNAREKVRELFKEQKVIFHSHYSYNSENQTFHFDLISPHGCIYVPYEGEIVWIPAITSIEDYNAYRKEHGITIHSLITALNDGVFLSVHEKHHLINLLRFLEQQFKQANEIE